MKCSDMIGKLIQKALQSPAKHRVSAVGLSKRGVIIAAAFNKPRFQKKGGGIHAEMAIMLMAPKCLHTIVIARVNKNGKILPMDPCPACAAKAKELGIKIVSAEER